MSEKITLSKQAIGAIVAPAEGRVYVRDALCPGLVLQLTAGGVRSLQRYKKIDGRPERLTLGVYDSSIPDGRALPEHVKTGDDAVRYIATRPGLSVKQARALVGLLPSASASPVELKRERSGSPTVDQVLDDYLELHMAVHSRAGKAAAAAAKVAGKDKAKQQAAALVAVTARLSGQLRRIRAAFGTTRLVDLKRADVTRWHVERVAEDGIYNGNRAVETLRAAVNFIVSQHASLESLRNPAAGVKRKKVHAEKSRKRYALPTELPLLLRQIELQAETWRDLFKLLLLVGARRGATMAMQWQHVDLKRAVWSLPAADSKNDEPLEIVLVPQAVEILQRRFDGRDPSPYVFPSAYANCGHITSPKGAWADVLNGMHTEMLSAALKQAGMPVIGELNYKQLVALAKKARVVCPRPDLRLHDMRRTLASTMAQNNVSLQIIGAALGHKSSEATEIYARHRLDDVRRAQAAAVDTLMAAR